MKVYSKTVKIARKNLAKFAGNNVDNENNSTMCEIC